MREKSNQFSLRLPVSLVERIEEFLDELREENPGLDINRAGVIKMLIVAGLNQTEKQS